MPEQETVVDLQGVSGARAWRVLKFAAPLMFMFLLPILPLGLNWLLLLPTALIVIGCMVFVIARGVAIAAMPSGRRAALLGLGRPTLVIVSFGLSMVAFRWTFWDANAEAARLALKLQHECDRTQRCPRFIAGWTESRDSTSFESFVGWAAQYPIRYTCADDDCERFWLEVKHGMDAGLSIAGGVGLRLTATMGDPAPAQPMAIGELLGEQP